MVLVSISCDNSIGYGVFLWEKKDSIYKTGEIINLIGKSTYQQTYLIRNKENDQLTEIPSYKIEYFENRKEAEKFLEDYKIFINMYALSEKINLLVRNEPTGKGMKIYSLEEGQLVKIISRQENPEKIGNYKNFWYLVDVSFQ